MAPLFTASSLIGTYRYLFFSPRLPNGVNYFPFLFLNIKKEIFYAVYLAWLKINYGSLLLLKWTLKRAPSSLLKSAPVRQSHRQILYIYVFEIWSVRCSQI